MKKLILILCIALLCVGCEVNYNLTINEDLSVTEDFNASDDKNFFDAYENSSINRVIGFILEPYLDTLNDNAYVTTPYAAKDSGGVTITKQYKDLSDYKNNTVFLDQFTNAINYSKAGNIITLSTTGAFSKDDQDQEKIAVEKGNISITLPFKVKEHNADEVNGNVYTWKSGKDDRKARELKIVFDSSKIVKKNNYVFIILTGVVVILLFMAYFFYKKIRVKKNSANEI